MGMSHTVMIVVGNVLTFKKTHVDGPSQLVTRYDETTGQPYNKTISTRTTKFTDWNGKEYSQEEYTSFTDKVRSAFFVCEDNDRGEIVAGVYITSISDGRSWVLNPSIIESYREMVEKKFVKLGINLPVGAVVYHNYS